MKEMSGLLLKDWAVIVAFLARITQPKRPVAQMALTGLCFTGFPGD